MKTPTTVAEALAGFPRESFTRTPTPLQRLPHLGTEVGGARGGPDVWMKRDDLTDLALGGDKPRKLEYEIAKALAEGPTRSSPAAAPNPTTSGLRRPRPGGWGSSAPPS